MIDPETSTAAQVLPEDPEELRLRILDDQNYGVVTVGVVDTRSFCRFMSDRMPSVSKIGDDYKRKTLHGKTVNDYDLALDILDKMGKSLAGKKLGELSLEIRGIDLLALDRFAEAFHVSSGETDPNFGALGYIHRLEEKYIENKDVWDTVKHRGLIRFLSQLAPRKKRNTRV